MATYSSDASQATVQPRMVHAGSITRRAVFSLTASLASGDIILGPKLPDEAIVDDVRVFIHPSAMVVMAIAVGDGNKRNRFLSTQNVSSSANVVRADNNIGYQYLFSDNVDMAALFDTIDVQIGALSGAASATGHVAIDVTYHMP